MKVRLKLSTLIKFCGGLLLLSLAVSASELITINDGIPIPKLPQAKQHVSDTQPCVEQIEEIRRDHGHLLKHHRDETMHQGIRTKKHSLVECINCHITPNSQGHYPSITSQEHFCRSCHAYAAVSIDCFQCHASRP